MRGTFTVLFALVLSGSSLTGFAQTRGATAEIPGPGTVKGKTYALVVGISDYQNEGIPDLKYAEWDARSFANYLRSKSGGSDAGNIVELYGSNATSTKIWELGISKYFQDLKKFKAGDRLFLYFSGHGGSFNSNNKDNAYFFVWDANSATDGDANLKISKIKNLIQTFTEEGVEVFFFFDACRSADVGVKSGNVQVNQIIEKPEGEILITASKGGKVAFESGKIGHGVFTYYLLRGLYGEADTQPVDNKITGYELDRYVKDHVRNFSMEEFKSEQIPFTMWGNSGEREETPLFEYNVAESPTALAALEQAKVPDMRSFGIASKGAPRSASKKINDVASQFELALSEQRVLEPSNNNALFYFDKLKSLTRSDGSEEYYRSSLLVTLFEMARKVINEDLTDKRNFLRIGIDIKTSDLTSLEGEESKFDTTYYKKAMLALQKYVLLSPPPFQNPNANSMLLYLNSRHATVNSVNNGQKESILQKLEAEIARHPDKPYLYYSKGLLYKSMGKVREANAAFMTAVRLSPRWTQPTNWVSELDKLEEH